MLIICLYGGAASQMRAFYMGYKLAKKMRDELVFDLSNYYLGYYQPYLLDCFSVPGVRKIAFKGGMEERISQMKNFFKSNIQVISNGAQLEAVYYNYNREDIYFLNQDGCEYESFCMKNKEFFFRYIGKDELTNEIFDMMDIYGGSERVSTFYSKVDKHESVAIHIRLGDYVKVGWALESDYDFYVAAIQWIRENVHQPHFYVFSDEISTVKLFLGEPSDITYMERNTKNVVEDIEHLLCFARCKHKILSKKSGYSLFAAVIGRNKWNIDGYTLIIENISIDKDNPTYQYVKDTFDQNLGCYQNEDLSRCVCLSREDIDYFKSRYQYIEYADKKSERKELQVKTKRGLKKKKNILFLTLQRYDDIMISGMQKMASVFSSLGSEVFFVGDGRLYQNENDVDTIGWTLENETMAKSRIDIEQGFRLYPYRQLNAKNSYIEFIKYLQKTYGNDFLIIIRKANVLKECKEKLKGITYVFVDFSDEFDLERGSKLADDEIEYLYENADIVITYKLEVYNEWKGKLGSKIHYIDITKFYPAQYEYRGKLEEPSKIKDLEESLYRQIYNLIGSLKCL